MKRRFFRELFCINDLKIIFLEETPFYFLCSLFIMIIILLSVKINTIIFMLTFISEPDIVIFAAGKPDKYMTKLVKTAKKEVDIF